MKRILWNITGKTNSPPASQGGINLSEKRHPSLLEEWR
jgi:hypothetical protein